MSARSGHVALDHVRPGRWEPDVFPCPVSVCHAGSVTRTSASAGTRRLGRRRWKTIVPVASSVRMPRLRSQLRGRLLQASAPTSGSQPLLPRQPRTKRPFQCAPEVARLDELPVRVADAASELEGVPGSAGCVDRQRAREIRHDPAALAPAAPCGADETVVGRAERRLRPGPAHEGRIDRALDQSSGLRRPGALPDGRHRRPGRRARPGPRRGASPFGRFAIGIRSTTRFSAGSMRAIASENSPLTQTAPDPTAMPSGPSPTGIVAVTRFVAGSMRETVPSSEFATHTEPSPNAMPVGPLPTPTSRR